MGRREGMGGHVVSRMKLRPVAQLTESDYIQPRCLLCNKAVSDDRCENGNFVGYCSSRCCTLASVRRRRGTTGNPRKNRWEPVYQRAIAAKGAWIDVPCETAQEAGTLQVTFSNKRGFESSRNGLIVSVRFMGVV